MNRQTLFFQWLFGLCLFALLGACSNDQTPQEQGADTVVITEESNKSDALYPDDPPEARLPEGWVEPTHYDLHLNIDPRGERFSGTTRIAVKIGELKSFWMHGNGLEVTRATAILPGGRKLPLAWDQVLPTGTVKVRAPEAIDTGEATLEFEYNAPFNTNLEGLYKVESGGESYAYTQFEATSARLAFPSFDEPAYKVTFDIKLTVPAEHVAITNTPESAVTDNEDGTRTHTFLTTKPLPTYLIAFAVGPFDVVEGETIPAAGERTEGIPVRGITTRGKADEIRFALANTTEMVQTMEDYFGTPYPYRKLDLIAVPDFSAGAMENAGAITYREQLILVNEDSSVGEKRSFFVVHGHELAHQWFGNLVTPVWWDDIWLNESFATWNAYIILDMMFPDQNYRESLQNSSAGVMSEDALASARPIREPIVRHADIGSAFNGITYRKGGGVLQMFESFLGTDAFRDGIRHYMQKHAWGNTTAEDFIGAIADANPQVDGEDLRNAFMSYILQPGMPVLTSTLHCDDEGGVSVTLTQERYLPAGSTGDAQQEWIVPACLSIASEGETSAQCQLLKERSNTVKLDTERCPDYLLPNTGGLGYYRWNVPAENWRDVLTAFDTLSAGEQLSTASNLSAALHAGGISLPDYLDAVPTLAASHSYRVALIPRGDAYLVKDYVATAEERAEMQRRIIEWYGPQLTRLNAKATLSDDEVTFRRLMMSTLALGGEDPTMRAELTEIARRYTGFGDDGQLHPEAVDPNLTYIALLTAANELGPDFAELLWQQVLASDNARVRQDLLSALGYSKNPDVAAVMRERILSPELRDNEIFYIFNNQMSHEENRQALFNWASENLDAVMARIPAWRQGQLPRQFEAFCSEEDAAAVEALFAPIIDQLESGPRYLANALESIRLCAAFTALHRSAPAVP